MLKFFGEHTVQLAEAFVADVFLGEYLQYVATMGLGLSLSSETRVPRWQPSSTSPPPHHVWFLIPHPPALFKVALDRALRGTLVLLLRLNGVSRRTDACLLTLRVVAEGHQVFLQHPLADGRQHYAVAVPALDAFPSRLEEC